MDMDHSAKPLYQGKAKTLYERDEDTLLVKFRDDLTAGDGEKKDRKAGKGALNAAISARFFEVLEEAGVKTHFLEFLPPDTHVVRRVEILPLEVICRNVAAGSLVRRFPFREGQRLDPPVLEMGYKSDEYHDPFLNDSVALALNLSTEAELAEIRRISLRVNDILRDFLLEKGILLVDFKLEFGRDREGNLLLADEISPDTCRFWDAETGEVMDKDRFRKDLGSVLEYYREVERRVLGRR
jgi:phosphoribosylaminoimidazole-succinocarboxamide synthase